MNKMVSFALAGAVVGLVLAQFFPDLGLDSAGAFGAGLGRAFGASKPFLRNAAIGAAVGAALGYFLSKKD